MLVVATLSSHPTPFSDGFVASCAHDNKESLL
jgi:hypothetical protein